jgi:LysM repeat protein
LSIFFKDSSTGRCQWIVFSVTNPSLAMASSAFPRSLLCLVAGVLAPVMLTQCKSTAKSYKDVSYDPGKLKTPAGHGLERKDYPFDESGAYRKDWVKNNSGGRDRSASPQAETETTTAVAGARKAPATTPASTSYPTYAEAAAARASGDSIGSAVEAGGVGATLANVPDPGLSAGGVELASAGMTNRAPAPAVAPAPAPAPVATKYHKVNSGDTLFALASKYKTSVPELKRVNGLSGDGIRVGQSLRIP